MKELIKITEHNGNQAVSARTLHEYLEVNSNFTTWCNRMFDYGFEEDMDYIPILENRSDGLPGKPRQDFVLTLDCAKEISMLQRNEKGKQARKYFIEVEKKAKNTYANISKLEALRLAVEIEEKNQALQHQIDTKYEPRSQFVDQVFNSDDLISFSVACKSLNLPFGRNTLFKHLRDKGILFKNSNEPKQQYVASGYFKLKEKLITKENGESFINVQTFITQKGLGYLAKIFGVVKPKFNVLKIKA